MPAGSLPQYHPLLLKGAAGTPMARSRPPGSGRARCPPWLLAVPLLFILFGLGLPMLILSRRDYPDHDLTGFTFEPRRPNAAIQDKRNPAIAPLGSLMDDAKRANAVLHAVTAAAQSAQAAHADASTLAQASDANAEAGEDELELDGWSQRILKRMSASSRELYKKLRFGLLGGAESVEGLGFDVSHSQWWESKRPDLVPAPLLLTAQPDDSVLMARARFALNQLVSVQWPRLFVAGLPTFPRVFARDGLMSAFLLDDAELLRDMLLFAAMHQGQQANSVTGEEPGKIFHELPGVSINSHHTDFAACDTTPLFLIAVARFAHLTLIPPTGLSKQLQDERVALLQTLVRHVNEQHNVEASMAPAALLRLERIRRQLHASPDEPKPMLMTPEALAVFVQLWPAVLRAVTYIHRHVIADGLFVDDPRFAQSSRFALKVTYWKDSVVMGRPNGQPSYPVVYTLAHAQALCAVRSTVAIVNFVRELKAVAKEQAAQATQQGEPLESATLGSLSAALLEIDDTALRWMEGTLQGLSTRMRQALPLLWDGDHGRFHVGKDSRGLLSGDGTDGIHATYYLQPDDLKPSQWESMMHSATKSLATPFGFRSMSAADDLKVPLKERYHTGSVWLFEQAFIHAAATCTFRDSQQYLGAFDRPLQADELAQLLNKPEHAREARLLQLDDRSNDDNARQEAPGLTLEEDTAVHAAASAVSEAARKGLTILEKLETFPERVDAPEPNADAGARAVPLGTHTQLWTIAAGVYYDRYLAEERALTELQKRLQLDAVLHAPCSTVTAGQLSSLGLDINAARSVMLDQV
ncbi:hypothetical protein CAOG_01437 [Capsaspora owczarzaki ATCC 30864]|uniref:Uncharacterized protein n=1 Tax=Capsaspora owczarzaki (strain ATCC 30864) TaxID=595528 RepID=A0A0D2VJC0_CAPO3|nr:hypothetical protein CAOG_01437 [Capsaspora owczarzaki ATCC 30864]KJE90062.1 hypothetical protein CAOG_001437 [Capsaspora owczarzaki ATCC 30864]|eukprot:XP_004364305.2 hypothetical protein CAOG_01437 [Capsaspora owczarzaki ATCC 30864]